jgi:hypothetical protein
MKEITYVCLFISGEAAAALTVSWTLPHQTLFPLPLVRVNKSCDNHLSTIIAQHSGYDRHHQGITYKSSCIRHIRR